jgi:hypothetical protein
MAVPAIKQLNREQAVYAIYPRWCHKSLTKMRLGHGDRMVETAIASNRPVFCSRRSCPTLRENGPDQI